jgi:hypothetical protein
MQPVVPEVELPVVHVRPMWEPSPQQTLQPMVGSGEPPVDVAASVTCRPHIPKAKAPKVAARNFADPFADGDSGTNCMRCGFRVELAREKRGLLTCSGCG